MRQMLIVAAMSAILSAGGVYLYLDGSAASAQAINPCDELSALEKEINIQNARLELERLKSLERLEGMFDGNSPDIGNPFLKQ